jgi:hypothetical protein
MHVTYDSSGESGEQVVQQFDGSCYIRLFRIMVKGRHHHLTSSYDGDTAATACSF